MKYTHQLYYGKVNIEGLVSTKRFLKPVTIFFLIPVAVFGLIIFGCALIPATGMDFGRYVKLEYHKQVKLYHRTNYITEVVASLVSDKNERNEACKQLIQML